MDKHFLYFPNLSVNIYCKMATLSQYQSKGETIFTKTLCNTKFSKIYLYLHFKEGENMFVQDLYNI